MTASKPRKSRKKKERLIFALDPSLSATGWALVKVKGGLISIVDCGEIPTSQDDSHGQRLRIIRNELTEIAKGHRITDFVKEKGFMKFIAVTQILFKVHGVCEERFSDFKFTEYPPTSVKKAVTGNGRASKDAVEKGVREFLELPDDYKFISDNASDAVAVALTFIIKKKLI